MTNKHPDKALDQIELIISFVLQAGVIISSLAIVIGLILFFTTQSAISYKYYISNKFIFAHTIPSVINSIKTGNAVGFIVLGVLLLILTPILRVATSIMLFIYKKDAPMGIVTLCVLLILIGSFYLGFATK